MSMSENPTSENVLLIPAFAARFGDEWRAEIPGDGGDLGGLGGLFASGENLHEARKALARTVLFAIKAGTIDGINADEVSAIQMLVTTPKTFQVADLGEG